MGERLVVEIKRGDREVAALYYHWSAYTIPALNILKSMNSIVLSKAHAMDDKQLQLALIRFAERSTPLGYFETGEEHQKAVDEYMQEIGRNGVITEFAETMLKGHGGISLSDLQYASNTFPDESFNVDDDLSRNEGLVAITETSIEDSIQWAACLVTVDLDDRTVQNRTLYEYDIAEYLAETEDFDEDSFVGPDDLPKSPVDLWEFSLDEIDIVREIIKISQSSYIRYGDTIYELKEG